MALGMTKVQDKPTNMMHIGKDNNEESQINDSKVPNCTSSQTGAK